MKQIELNNKKYNIPENWMEVTLAKQIQVSNDALGIEIEELKQFAILSAYAGIPLDELKHAKIDDLQDLFTALAFINTELPQEALIEFDFKGRHYYCGQNLVDMEFQDFISIENTIKAYSGSTQQSLPTILAIMCKQKKADGILETLDDYDVKARAEEFLDLPIPIANSLSLFFSHNEKIFSEIIPLSLREETLEAAMQKQIESAENTLKKLGGMGLLHRCAASLLRYYLRYTIRQLDKRYTSTQ